jgi:tripartite-type tricarboxylate transporter receptor subunit TctC
MKPGGFLGLILGVFLILGLMQPLSEGVASDYPRKPITAVVSWPAGSGTGVVGQKLVNIINQNKYLPQPIQMVYKPGGAGTIGLAEVLQGRADGYTIAYNPSAPIIIQPLVKELPYNHGTMIPVLMTAKNPCLFVVRSDARWKTIQEFLEYAKTHPGEAMVGTAGEFTWPHVALLDLMKASSLKFRHVPFQGDAPAVTALLGGHVPIVTVQVGSASAQVAAGKLRFLACMEEERTPFAPDAPTIKELGYNVKGILHTHIVTVPKATPQEIVVTLHDAFKKAMDTEDYSAFMKNVGSVPSYVGYRELPALIDTTVKEITQLLEGIGVKVRKVQ